MKKVLRSLLCILLATTMLVSVVACSKEEHTHTFADAWSSSDEKHWKASTCGHDVKDQEGDHVFGNGEMGAENTKIYYTCQTCGYIKSEEHTHVYGEWKTQTPATLFADGVEYRVCTYVGCEAKETRPVSRIALESILITTMPSKLMYNEGEALDVTGLAVMAVGADGSHTDVTALVSVDKTVLTCTDTTVTVSYEGKTATFSIVVWGLSNHSHTFDGVEWIVSSPATIFTEGQKYRVCSFDGCEEREVETILRVEVNAITVTRNPSKTEYAEGELFDAAGMVVMATGADASSTDVTALVSFNKTTLAVGDTQVTVSYAGKTATVAVIVHKIRSVAEVLSSATDGQVILVEGLFAGVADEGSGFEKEMLLKDTASDKLIALHGVSYGSFPDYGYDKGDLVRLWGTVVRERYDTAVSSSENKTYLQFSAKNPASVSSTVVSRGNQMTYALSNATTITNHSELQAFFTAASVEAYTYIRIQGDIWINSYYAAADSVPLHRFGMSSSITSLSAMKCDGRAVGFRQNVLEANVPAAMTSYFDRAFGTTTYPGNKRSVDFYAVVTATNIYNFQLTILESGWLLGKEAETITIGNNQDIVKEVGFAYYRQGNQIHYDQRYRNENASPEDATAQQQIYLDCSTFVNAVYFEAFGENILGVPVSESAPTTERFSNYARDNLGVKSDVIGYWETADYTTDDARAALLTEVMGMLQVGDVLVYRRGKNSPTSGHTLLYIGNNIFLHSSGSMCTDSTTPESNQDVATVEEITRGTVQKIWRSALTTPGDSRYLFRADSSITVFNFCVIRPLARNLTPTEKTTSRMAIAGLAMEKTVTPGVSASIVAGDEIIYTLRIENHSSNVYTNVLFEDVLSEHLTFLWGSDGISVDGQRVSKRISIGAMETLTIHWAAKVRTNTPVGAYILSNATTLGGVKIFDTVNTVGAYTAEQLKAVADKAREYAASGTTFTDPLVFAKTIYRDVFDTEIFDVDTAMALLADLFAAQENGTILLNETSDYADMVVPHLYMGALIPRITDAVSIYSEGNLMLGDLIFCESGDTYRLFVYVGNGEFVRVDTVNTGATLVENGLEGYSKEDSSYVREDILSQLRTYEQCVILRPSINPAP